MLREGEVERVVPTRSSASRQVMRDEVLSEIFPASSRRDRRKIGREFTPCSPTRPTICSRAVGTRGKCSGAGRRRPPRVTISRRTYGTPTRKRKRGGLAGRITGSELPAYCPRVLTGRATPNCRCVARVFAVKVISILQGKYDQQGERVFGRKML